ncbi:hypothetical protein HK101_009453 [Irineochytrium annulatum]|nr:hypothetical protein HK101_009453 [Irineochytrium annulatum]
MDTAGRTMALSPGLMSENVTIPPEPEEKWTELLAQGKRFNDRLLKTHAFANPSIMSKLIEFFGLDEYGTNFRPELFDRKFDASNYVDAIANERKRRMELDQQQIQQQQAAVFNYGLATVGVPNRNRPGVVSFVSKGVEGEATGSAGGSAGGTPPVVVRKRGASKWDNPEGKGSSKQ